MGSSISKRSMRGSRWRVIGEHSRRGKPLCLILCPIFRTLDACQARYFARLQANSCDQCEESWGERLCPIVCPHSCAFCSAISTFSASQKWPSFVGNIDVCCWLGN